MKEISDMCGDADNLKANISKTCKKSKLIK